MLEIVKTTIETHSMLQKGETVLVALSGGADSVALLHALLRLGYRVCAFHLNHELRGAESERDEAFCRAMCAKCGVPLIVERYDVRTYAQQQGESVETAARRLRYARFAAAADGAKIATAHTADDNVETILFHLLRGTGPKGLAGIPPVRGQVIRPLIAAERADIEAFLRRIGQNFVTDSTNLSNDYTRNRIRHEVVPALRGIEPRLPRAAGRLSRLLRQDEDFLNGQTSVLLDAARRDGGWNAAALCEAHPAIRSRALRRLLCAAGMPQRDLAEKHIVLLEELLQSGNPSAALSLPHGFSAWREYDLLCAGRMSEPAKSQSVSVGIPSQSILWDGKTRLTLRCCEKNKDIYKSFNTFCVDCGTIALETLCVRTRLPGDRMRLTENGGSKTLKKLLIDRKIPKARRNCLAVVADAAGVIAVQDIGLDVSRRPQGGEVIEIQFEG